MNKKEKEGVQWLEFDLLSEVPEVIHAVFLRQGGISEGNYASLNFGDGVGDSEIHVEYHHTIAKTLLGIPHLTYSKQCHGIEIVDCKIPSSSKIYECDAQTTSDKGLGLMVKHADCQAAIFYDPIQHVIANAHSGWRGSVQNIYGKLVNHMKQKYGSKAENLLVCIGPSLGPQSAQFINYKEELPQDFWKFQVQPNYFDFWEISRFQLQKAGILKHHLEIACIDNHLNEKDFYSYRRNRNTGRHATIVALKL